MTRRRPVSLCDPPDPDLLPRPPAPVTAASEEPPDESPTTRDEEEPCDG
jgi:hypothetical protein